MAFSYSIYDFMISDLELGGSEAMVYALIYSFTKGSSGKFSARRKFIEKACGITPATITRKLQSLLEKGYIYTDGKNTLGTVIYKADLELVERILENKKAKEEVPVPRRERTQKSPVMIKAENKEPEDYFDYFGDQGLVMLTWRQYEQLLAIESESIVNQYICRLEATIMQYPGFSAHSHYRTILKWMEDDARV